MRNMKKSVIAHAHEDRDERVIIVGRAGSEGGDAHSSSGSEHHGRASLGKEKDKQGEKRAVR